MQGNYRAGDAKQGMGNFRINRVRQIEKKGDSADNFIIEAVFGGWRHYSGSLRVSKSSNTN